MIPLDPLTGLPRRTSLTQRPTLPRLTLGPGPAEPKSPLLGGYATGDPLALGPGPAEPKSPLVGGYGGPTATRTLTGASGLTGDSPLPGAAQVQAPPAASIENLQGLIQADPLYKQTQADIAAQRAADQGARTAARQRELVRFGSIPDLNSAAGALGLVGSDIGSDITDTTRQLAQQNTSAGLSTTAKLDQAYKDVVNKTTNDLTARGLLSSGETGYQLGREQLADTQNRSDAFQQLLDYLASIQNSYLGNENSRAAAIAAAAQAAAGRIPPTVAPSDYSPVGSVLAGQIGGANPDGRPITVAQGVNDQVPTYSLPDFTNPDLTGLETPAGLQAGVGVPDPRTGLFPWSSALPAAINSIVNPTGLSANARQGVYAIH